MAVVFLLLFLVNLAGVVVCHNAARSRGSNKGVFWTTMGVICGPLAIPFVLKFARAAAGSTNAAAEQQAVRGDAPNGSAIRSAFRPRATTAALGIGKNMSRFKHAVDAPLSTAWIERVGKLILNFGVLELETYLWLVQLSEAPDRIPEFTSKPFALRAQEISAFVDTRAFSGEWKISARSAWCEALEHAQLRNRIAHSPLAFGWSGPAEEGEPDFIGVIDLRRRDDRQNPLVSKSEMDVVINSIVTLASRLSSLRVTWCSIRDAGGKNA